jgi:hypothetical protein
VTCSASSSTTRTSSSIGGLLGKALGRIPQPGATAEHSGLVMTGGASRGRNRGIATVIVERAEVDDDNDETAPAGSARERNDR